MSNLRRRTKLSGKKLRKTITVLIVTAAAAVLLVLFLKNKVSEEYADKDESDVLSAKVSTGSINTSVYGSGMLSDDDEEKILIPDGVELEKIHIQAGDTVQEAALLATVDTNSVMSAMVSLNDEIKTLDTQINSASLETIDNLITSSVYGRVKAVFAEKGDQVLDVMMENGALMLLSLDGYMAVDIPAGDLVGGETVSILSSAGNRYTAKIERVLGDTATVLVTDDGPLYEDLVTVEQFDGTVLGTGALYIHDPLRIIGYTGSVNYIWAKENKQVFSGSSLIELVGQSYTVNMDALLAQRKELEEKMEELISFYRQGGIYAPFGGTVKEITATDKDSEDTQAEEDESAASQYITISPDKTMSVSVSVDESDILSLSVGQQAAVTVNSLGDDVQTGSVTGIDRAGTSSGGVTSYTATVSIEKKSGMLSGMSASTTISIEGVDNALLIPVDALNKTSSSYYVYTEYDESTNTLGGMKEVSVGISNANYAEITSGLSEGDTVYYEEAEENYGMFMSGNMPQRRDEMSFGGSMNFGGAPGGTMPGGMADAMPGRR